MVEKPPAGVSVGGNGTFSPDDTAVLLSICDSTLDGVSAETYYKEDSNSIITIVYLDGVFDLLCSAYTLDPDETTASWGSVLSNYAELDASYRGLIEARCDTEVDTMFAIADSENSPELLVTIENGELTIDWVSMIFEIMAAS